MSNSPLIVYTALSPNCSPRTRSIDKITIHHMAGVCSVEVCGELFKPASRGGSSNYGIGNDGRVALYVPEDKRAWTSDSIENDDRAVTIEVSNSFKGDPWPVSDEAYQSLIDLCVDICQRNGIERLNYTGDTSGNLTVHRWFQATACPGEYLMGRMGQIADEVNAKLETASGYTAIAGTAKATVAQMRAYIKAKNPSVPQSVLDMISLYLSEGAAEGIRGDVAFAQSCLETGNFTFAGSAVTLDQNNFCGMGVTENGMKGNSFATPQAGIRAQIQHLKAYANTVALNGACVDPRFSYVTRGCAEYVEWLGQKENPNGKGWATGAGYGEKILSILAAILATAEPETETEGKEMRYNKISEMPSYARPTIVKMVDAGLIGGTGTGAKDENNRPADLDLSIDMIRVFITNDRAGLYDREA